MSCINQQIGIMILQFIFNRCNHVTLFETLEWQMGALPGAILKPQDS